MKQTVLRIFCHLYFLALAFAFTIGICLADASLKLAFLLMAGSAFLIWVSWPRIEPYLDDGLDDENTKDEV